MAKRPVRDNLLTIVGIASAVLIAGFIGAWFYLKHAEKLTREVTYLELPAVAISTGGHSIRATFAIKTSSADADWAAKNKRALEQVSKQVLLGVDPKRARAPNGLQILQDTLRETSNATLQTDKVREVLVTDFLVSEGDF